jgi:hypothetical protein
MGRSRRRGYFDADAQTASAQLLTTGCRSSWDQYSASVHAAVFQLGDGVGERIQWIGVGAQRYAAGAGERDQVSEVVVAADGVCRRR